MLVVRCDVEAAGGMRVGAGGRRVGLTVFVSCVCVCVCTVRVSVRPRHCPMFIGGIPRAACVDW